METAQFPADGQTGGGLGSTFGLLFTPPITLPLPETILTIALGILLATNSPLPLIFVASLATLLGLFHGLLNGCELPKALRVS